MQRIRHTQHLLRAHFHKALAQVNFHLHELRTIGPVYAAQRNTATQLYGKQTERSSAHGLQFLPNIRSGRGSFVYRKTRIECAAYQRLSRSVARYGLIRNERGGLGIRENMKHGENDEQEEAHGGYVLGEGN